MPLAHRAVIIVLVLIGSPLSADDATPMARLRAYLENLQTLQAEFRQEIVDVDQKLVEAASGRVSLMKPGRFRWDYLEPFERVIVANGTRVWLYEADLEQVTIRTLDAALGETPAALLSGDPEVLDRFEYVDGNVTDNSLRVDLRPSSLESDFDLIRLLFERDQLTELTLRDRLGQTTRIELLDVELNEALDADTFVFEVPEGADVIGETEL